MAGKRDPFVDHGPQKKFVTSHVSLRGNKHENLDEMSEELSMILIMGMTGSGKSYFVNRLVANAAKESPNLTSRKYCDFGLFVQSLILATANFVAANLEISETETCQVVQVRIGAYPVALVDTPGFDDTFRSDAEVLDEILQFMISQHRSGIPLRGIIYLHKITDNRMTGSSVRYLEIFKKLCGIAALPNVFLITTHWNELKDPALGCKRDQQLRDRFWRAMVDLGSSIYEFHGSPEEAEGILIQLVSKPCVELDIQTRLIHEKMPFATTPAGQLALPAIDEDITEVEKELAYLQSKPGGPTTYGSADSDTTHERRQVERKRNILRRISDKFRSRDLVSNIESAIDGEKKSFPWKDALQIFSSVVGIGVVIASVVLTGGVSSFIV
jgi:hypothetical protein